jgi:hypothetical protein
VHTRCVLVVVLDGRRGEHDDALLRPPPKRLHMWKLQTDLALISKRCRSNRSRCCSSRSQSLQAAPFYSRPLHRGSSSLASRTSEGAHDALLRRSPKDGTRNSRHNLALISNRCRSSRSQSLQAAPSGQLQSILPRAVAQFEGACEWRVVPGVFDQVCVLIMSVSSCAKGLCGGCQGGGRWTRCGEPLVEESGAGRQGERTMGRLVPGVTTAPRHS